MAQITELSLNGVMGRVHSFTAKTEATQITGGKFVAGQLYAPGFKEGEIYNPGFKEGEIYNLGFKEGETNP